MTNEELVAQIQKGIRVKENMSRLWEQNYGFILRLTRTYSANTDDLLQEGYKGLCEAVRRYDSKRRVNFLTYAGYWIRCKMGQYNRKDVKALDVKWLDQQITNSYSDTTSYKDFLESTDDVEEEVLCQIWAEQLGNVLWALVDDLPPKTKVVIRGLYQQGKTKEQLSHEMECNCDRIYQIHNEGLLRLRKPENLNKLRAFL